MAKSTVRKINVMGKFRKIKNEIHTYNISTYWASTLFHSLKEMVKRHRNKNRKQ